MNSVHKICFRKMDYEVRTVLFMIFVVYDDMQIRISRSHSACNCFHVIVISKKTSIKLILVYEEWNLRLLPVVAQNIVTQVEVLVTAECTSIASGIKEFHLDPYEEETRVLLLGFIFYSRRNSIFRKYVAYVASTLTMRNVLTNCHLLMCVIIELMKRQKRAGTSRTSTVQEWLDCAISRSSIAKTRSGNVLSRSCYCSRRFSLLWLRWPWRTTGCRIVKFTSRCRMCFWTMLIAWMFFST